MILMVTGGSGSGKSEYAEDRAVLSGLPCRYYIATMKVWGREERQRILRHQAQRRGKGFSTIEAQRDLEQIRLFTPPEQTAVLLECITNLTANELFEGDGECEERILEGIGSLAAQCSLLVVVTGQVDQDGGDYDEGTRSYMRLLGRVNCRLAAMADQVVETVAGIPVILKQNKKGGLPV